MKQKIMRLLSLLLAVTLFLGTQGFTVFAQTTSGNGTEAVGNKEKYNDGKGESNLTEPEVINVGVEANVEEEDAENDAEYQQDSGNSQQEIFLDGNVSENNARAGEGTPANPIHHCNTEDETQDTTTWSYVYFGSYPQSEVTDSTTITAIDSAISQGMGQAAGTAESSEGTDIWVSGTKYRRISKADTNYSGYFDEVTNNGYRYFKWERIKWRVLQNNGSTLFVVADKAIDCKDYNEEYKSITWETSTIRNWLNNSFYNTAFSSSEQGAIITQNVLNEDNPEYGTEGGNNTRDNVYLFSISEVTNAAYGFCSDYSTCSMSRRMKASDYANARGIWRNSDSGYEGNCWWWLRSSGGDSHDAAIVHSYGWAPRDGDFVNVYVYGVCPALHINLSSGIWSMADDGTSGEGGNGGGDDIHDLLNLESAVYSYGTKTVDLTKEVHYIENDHQAFDLKCQAKGDDGGTYTYELYSGSTKIAECTGGEFGKVEAAGLDAGADVYINVSDGNSSLETRLLLMVAAPEKVKVKSLKLGGDGISFTLDDEVPLLGGYEMNFNLPEVPINAVVEDGRIKIGINVTEESLYSANSIEGNTTTTKKKSFRDKFEDYKKDLAKASYMLEDADINEYLVKNDYAGQVPGLSKSCKVKVIGYAEAAYSDALEEVKGELLVQISGAVSLEKQVILIKIPVALKCDFTAAGTATGSLCYNFINNKPGGSVKAGLKITIEPYAGVGVGTWASVGVYGTAEAGVQATIISSDTAPGLDEFYMYGELGLTAYFAKRNLGKLPLLSMKNLKKTKLRDYIDENNHLLLYSRTKNAVISGKKSENTQQMLWSPAGVGEDAMSWAPEVAAAYHTGIASGVVADNAYAAARPQYICTDDVTMLVFVDNDTSRLLANQTVLKYAILDKETNTWGAPLPVADDGTADCNPHYYVADNEIYVYYQNSREVFSEAQPELSDYIGSFGITVAKYDLDRGNFEVLGTVNCHNVYAYVPQMAETASGMALVWAENDENDVFALNAANSIYICYYNKETKQFETPEMLKENLNSVTSLAAGSLSGKDFVAYCEDKDNNLATAQQKLCLMDVDGNVLTEQEGEYSNLQYTSLPGMSLPTLAWNAAGNIAYLAGTNQTIQMLFEEPFLGVGTDFKAEGECIYYLGGITDESRNVQALVLQGGSWDMMRITDEDDYVDDFSVDGDSIAYVLTKAKVQDASTDFETSSQIKLLTDYNRHDIALETADYSVYEAVPGREASFRLILSNHGTGLADRVNVALKDKSGQIIDEKAIDIGLHPGETVQKEVKLMLPESFDIGICTLEAYEDGVTDSDNGNNAVPVDFGRSELAVETAYLIEEEQPVLKVKVSNISYIEENASVVVKNAGGRTVGRAEFPVKAQSDTEWEYVIVKAAMGDSLEDNVLTVTVAGTKEEYYQHNNTETQRITQVADVEFPDGAIDSGDDDENKDNDGNKGDGGNKGDEGNKDSGNNGTSEGEKTQNSKVRVTKVTITGISKKIAAGKKIKLTAKILPENATDKALTWKSSNTKYATVTSKGKVTLKKAGVGKTVKIIAVAKDGSGVTATYKIKIMKHAVKSIKLKSPSKTLKAGRSMTVKATVSTTGKSVNKTLKWQSSNTKYATVNKKGKVTAKKAGKGKTVTVTAMSTDGSNKKAKVKIKIK